MSSGESPRDSPRRQRAAGGSIGGSGGLGREKSGGLGREKSGGSFGNSRGANGSAGSIGSMERQARENVGLRAHSKTPQIGIDDRATITNAASLFQRSASNASLATERSTASFDMRDEEPEKKLIYATNHRRSSVAGVDEYSSPRLVYNTSYGGKMLFYINKDENSIGRRDQNDIVLNDFKVSKKHAVIIKTSTGYALKDTASANGVRLNDKQLVPNELYPLRDNDEIQIGQFALKFFDVNHKDKNAVSADNEENNYTKLVTILPSEKKYEETVTIRAEIEAEEEVAFSKSDQVADIDTLRADYEKLRLVYELSKTSVTDDVNKILSKSLDLMFEILPLDRGVVLMVDQSTGFLSTHYVKLRSNSKDEKREILLSSTILNKVFYSRKCLVTSDACEDPMLGKAASVRHGQIRSVICVPLIAHGKVYGILHLDAKDRINAYSSKDISLIKAIGNQTAIIIENMNLIKEVEAKVKITEQLSRFLPPHVVEKMTSKSSEMIRKGGKECVGTVVFADIRGFTNLSEKSTPMEVVTLLNEYFERLVKIVFKYDGIVDKYIGDAIMAVFGTLEDQAEAEYRATMAGIEFQQAIAEMNEERRRMRKDPISIGVGINTGVLLAGFIGSSQRLEYTCIGDTVNTSSRICDSCAGDKVYISESTYKMVEDLIHCRLVGQKEYKGKREPITIYEAVRIKRRGE